MKAHLLARVSTDDQKDALPAQTYRLTEYAKRRGYIYELFELRESAYKSNRAEFSTIVAGIKSLNEPSIVVFDKIDRYTRDSSSGEVRTLDALRKSGKIEIHFPSDNLYIHKDSPATDLLRLGMGIVVAQYYSDAISDNVKRRFEQKLRDGEWIGKAPVGYRNNVLPNGKKWVEPDPATSEAVIEAFRMYASGTSSLREIASKWRKEYALTVGSSKIDQTLQNPFYYGEMSVKGVNYPHKYLPLIDRSLFEDVRNVSKGYKVKKHRWGGLPYAYRGLISCAECGCRITFEKKKGQYIYGHCTRTKYKHPAKYVSEDAMTAQLMKTLSDIEIPEHAYEEVSEALKQAHNDKKKMLLTTQSNLDTQIANYQSRVEKVYEDYLDEKIPEDLYKRKFDEYRDKQRILKERREKIELIDDEYYLSAAHLLRLARDAPKLFKVGNIEQKRTIISLVHSNLLLDQDQLRWEYKKPFNTMALCNKNAKWLPGLDSNSKFYLHLGASIYLGLLFTDIYETN